MVAIPPSRETPEEHLIHWFLVGTWALWFVGGLYHAIPALGWMLVLLVVCRWIGVIDDPSPVHGPTPWGVHAWAVGMFFMAIALIAGHLNFDLGLVAIVKSLFGWAKGWGLLAAFIFVGAELRIKPEVVYRASNILALQTLLITPIFFIFGLLNLPGVWYVSPLLYLGGPGPLFFEVGSHLWDASALGFRLRYFAPWAPAAAFAAHIALVLALNDKDWRWRWIGIVSAILACALTQSRLSLVAVPVLLAGLPILANILSPWPAAAVSAMTTFALLFLTQVKDTIDDMVQAFIGARADSSRVRAALARMAYHRWETEAPWFGHGTVERGSHYVEYMPIGSHHTWHGLLFIKGGVGFVALALPLAWTFCEMLVKAQRDRHARAGLGIVLVLLFNSFGENLEILAYLAWPGLIVIGIAMKRRLAAPPIWAAFFRQFFAPIRT